MSSQRHRAAEIFPAGLQRASATGASPLQSVGRTGIHSLTLGTVLEPSFHLLEASGPPGGSWGLALPLAFSLCVLWWIRLFRLAGCPRAQPPGAQPPCAAYLALSPELQAAQPMHLCLIHPNLLQLIMFESGGRPTAHLLRWSQVSLSCSAGNEAVL